MSELKSCPWDIRCHLEIHVEDDEGNDHGILGCEYEDNPWSGGPWYVVYHDGECAAGVFSFGRYSSVAELIQAWNTRYERTCRYEQPNPQNHPGVWNTECGHHIYWNVDNDDCGTPPDFCTKCGAKVIS